MIPVKERFNIQYGTQTIPFSYSVFSGGEVNVKLLPPSTIFCGQACTIEAKMTRPEDLVILMMLKDAVVRMCRPSHMKLRMPYIPYARQDRVMANGEALAIKVFCQAINAMQFDLVVVADSHSDVATACLERCIEVKQEDVFSPLISLIQRDDVAVAPDAGASKKCLKVAKKLGFTNFIQAGKVRDVRSGTITSTQVYAERGEVEGKVCYIFDDICDNGGTFIALAKKLKELGAAKVILCVTHGIFPNGVDHIFEAGVNQIITTNSLFGWKKDERIEVINQDYHIY